MPIYVYQCSSCSNEFEAIRRIKEADASIRCPDCHSLNTVRVMAVFYAQSGSRITSFSKANCSTCGSSNCSNCRR